MNIIKMLVRLIRNRKYFQRILIYALLLAVGPNLIFSIIAYYHVSRSMERESSVANLQYLSQTITGMEIIANQIKSTSKLVILNESFRNFESFPNGKYYQNLKGEIDVEDLPGNYRYIKNKQEAIRSLVLLKLNNEFVDTAYFFDSNKNLILSMESGGVVREYDYENFYDKGWESLFQPGSPDNIVMMPRDAVIEGHQTKSVLTTVISTGLANNAFIINLDRERVYERVLQKLNKQNDLFIISMEGHLFMEPVVESTDAALSREILALSNEISEEPGFFYTDINGQKLLLTHSDSSLLNWRFISVTDWHEVSKGIVYLKRIMTYSIVFLLVMGIGIAIIMSQSLYRPIHQIASTLRSKLSNSLMGEGLASSDELHYIGNAVQTAIVEKDLLEQKLNESMPYYRRKFKSSLLTRSGYSLEEIEDKQQLLQLNIPLHDIVLMVISIDDYEERLRELNTNHYELYKLELEERLESCDLLPGDFFIADISEDKIAVAVQLEKQRMDQLFIAAQHVMELLQSTMHGSFSIGVGQHCHDILELPRAYREAMEALKFKIVYGSGQVIYIEDVLIQHAHTFSYPKEKEKILNGYIRQGNTEGAKAALDSIHLYIQEHQGNLHYTHIQAIFMQLLSSIVSTLQSIGAAMNSIFPENPYGSFSKLQSVSEIVRWFELIIDKTAKYVDCEMQSKGNQHVEKILEIINRNIGADLSLYYVASQLKLNPAYVGRLFKQMMGKSFVEYVTELRIEQSKELLVKEQISINEISSKVGYHNAYYFIKLFKENVGLTPGEYRKLFTESAQ